jgi:bacteriocin-like protein
MKSTPASKDSKTSSKSSKPVADELRDDELQEVSGGLAANNPAVAKESPVCISKL